MKAGDVMARAVVSVAPEASVTSIARLLLERRISAVPVIDANQRQLGIWGGVRSEAERAAIALAARRSRGVTGVKSHIVVMPPGLTAALGGL